MRTMIDDIDLFSKKEETVEREEVLLCTYTEIIIRPDGTMSPLTQRSWFKGVSRSKVKKVVAPTIGPTENTGEIEL